MSRSTREAGESWFAFWEPKELHVYLQFITGKPVPPFAIACATPPTIPARSTMTHRPARPHSSKPPVAKFKKPARYVQQFEKG